MFERGYLTVASVRGVPLRLHWSTALGALLFGGLSFAPAAWFAFLVLVVLHEFGHALVVWRLRHRVVSIDVTGFGGLCRWSGLATPSERALIAWGGVLAQSVLLVAALALALLGVWGTVPFGAELAHTFVWTNLWLIILNLLPFAPLDGAEAWRLLSELKSLRRRSLRAREGRELLEQILAQPAPRRAPPSEPATSRAAHRGHSAAQEPSRRDARDDTGATRELADRLRQIGDEAGRARRGGDH
ncbi:MAG: hypothetical protein JW751_14200 [Polyangiaceae bacterium]|nr:hypothetical protein [Polyangiaceae bacterium]